MTETKAEAQISGTDLYHQTMATQYASEKQAALMHEVWDPTPWMVDAITVNREAEMIAWCHRVMGPESSPIHGKGGSWHRGNVTLRGRTWFGFQTKELLEAFLARFPEVPNPHDELFDWPLDEGIWMGNVEAVGWFPFRTMALKDDLPSKEQMRLERESPETAPPRAILCITAQWLQEDSNWPYLFKSNHPAREW